jgi:hypothetical protein
LTEGRILDISGQGAFFAPGHPVTWVVNEAVAIRFDSEPNLRGLDIPARVRWVGFSPRHNCHGFGLEFQHRPVPF